MTRILFGLPLILGLSAVPVTTQTFPSTHVYPVPRGPFYVESHTGRFKIGNADTIRHRESIPSPHVVAVQSP